MSGPQERGIDALERAAVARIDRVAMDRDAIDRLEARTQGIARPVVFKRAATRREDIDGMAALCKTARELERRSLGTAP